MNANKILEFPEKKELLKNNLLCAYRQTQLNTKVELFISIQCFQKISSNTHTTTTTGDQNSCPEEHQNILLS